MYLRKILVRQLLRLYPAAWRTEYGEEMGSMLLAQPLTASVAGDVFLNAIRQNLRRPDPWKAAGLFLVCWRSFWIVLPSVFQFSPAAWALFVQVDRSVFVLVAFSSGCWTVINEGDVWRGGLTGWVNPDWRPCAAGRCGTADHPGPGQNDSGLDIHRDRPLPPRQKPGLFWVRFCSCFSPQNAGTLVRSPSRPLGENTFPEIRRPSKRLMAFREIG